MTLYKILGYDKKGLVKSSNKHIQAMLLCRVCDPVPSMDTNIISQFIYTSPLD